MQAKIAKILTLLALFLLQGFLSAWPANAAPRKHWAMLIGVNKYQNVTSLNYAVADVVSVKDLLLKFGYDKDKVLLMTTDQQDKDVPTRANVLKRLQALTQQIGPEDTLLFYFSGHGFSQKESGDEQYLATCDTDLGDLKKSALSLRSLMETISASPVKQMFFILDACRNDPTKSVESAKAESYKNMAKEANITKEYAVLSSCANNETSIERQEFGHGLFSYCLMKGMRGKALNPERPERQVTVNSLIDYVAKEVPARSGSRQNPWQNIKCSGNFVLIDSVPPDEKFLSDTEPQPQQESPRLLKSDSVALTRKNEPTDHSLSFSRSVTYPLEGDYEYFETALGFGPQFHGRAAAVTCRVLLDGKETTDGETVVNGAEDEPVMLRVKLTNDANAATAEPHHTITLQVEPPMNSRLAEGLLWWGKARLTNEVKNEPPRTTCTLNMDFRPNAKLRIKEWTWVIDGKTRLNNQNDQVAVTRGKHKIELRWKGQGYEHGRGKYGADTFYESVTVRFTVHASEEAQTVILNAKVDTPLFSNPKLHLDARLDGKPVPSTNLEWF